MLKRKTLLISIILLFFPFTLLLSDTIIVDITVAGDYTSIQQGIDNSTNGDTVLVYPGIYYENINYNGKNITIGSLYLNTQNNCYIDSTIIDGNQNGSVVTFANYEDSTAVLCGFTIQNGSGIYDLHNIRGGGIFSKNADPKISCCIIKNNNAEIGAGIHCRYSTITLENTTIRYNHAFMIGGGIHLRDSSTINFSPVERCNIYCNYSGIGCDIDTYQVAQLNVIVDTFTVLEPDSYFAHSQPENNFNFDILNAKIEPVNQDLYVNPDGDNGNSGLNDNVPLKTVSFALTKIASDSTHPNTIHLSNGIYSTSINNENFPINCRSYVSIIGESEEVTLFDGEYSSSLIKCIFGDSYFSIENITLQHGNYRYGSAIDIGYNSNPIFRNIIIKDNDPNCSEVIHCRNNSNALFDNISIMDNSIELTPVRCYECNPIFLNCIIHNNETSSEAGASGGITFTNCNPIIINCLIYNNEANDWIWGYGGGLNIGNGIIINSTICDNFANTNGGGIYSITNNVIINSILYNNSNNQIGITNGSELTVSYSDIQDGEAGIGGSGTIHWLEGNIDSLPQFVGGDPFSYELTEGSPCVDAGTPDTTGLHLPATDLAGNQRIYNGRIDIGCYEFQDTISVHEPDTSFIHNLYLFKNTPNPFKESTTISFISADYERIKDYTLSIYNTKGQLVKRYKGSKDNFWVRTEIVWDGTDDRGRQVAPGTYLYKLEYNGNAVVRKMVKLR